MLYDSLVYQDPSSSGLCAGVDSLEDDAASLVASVARSGPGVTGAAVTSLDNMTTMTSLVDNMTSIDNMTNLVDNMTNMASLVDTGPTQVAGTSVYSGAGEQGKSLTQASHGGSNEDMKKVLMELDNTGYFAEVNLMTASIN